MFTPTITECGHGSTSDNFVHGSTSDIFENGSPLDILINSCKNDLLDCIRTFISFFEYTNTYINQCCLLSQFPQIPLFSGT